MKWGNGESRGTLPQLMTPSTIEIYENHICIGDKATVYIYSLKDLTLQKTFGKAGEGPQEFKLLPYGEEGLQIHQENGLLYITSIGKLSIFTKDGDFKMEKKTMPNLYGDLYKPVQSGFIGLGSSIEKKGHYITVNLYDSHLKKIKELCKWPYPAQQGKGTRVFSQSYIIHSYEGKTFLGGTSELTIDVFSGKGDKIFTIHKDYKKIKISESKKKQVLKWLETGPEYKHIYNFMKPILFSDHFPAIRDFRVTDKKIYVLTFNNMGEKKEFLILDLNGNLLKKTFLLLKDKNAFSLYPYTIYKGILYQLVEDEENEMWGLHCFPCK